MIVLAALAGRLVLPDSTVALGDPRWPSDPTLPSEAIDDQGRACRAQLEQRDDDGTRWVLYSHSDGDGKVHAPLVDRSDRRGDGEA